MSDNRSDSTIGGERDRQGEFGNAEDSDRKDTQNTREDAEFDNTDGGQFEDEQGAGDVEGDDEGASGDADEADDDALIPDDKDGTDTGTGPGEA